MNEEQIEDEAFRMLCFWMHYRLKNTNLFMSDFRDHESALERPIDETRYVRNRNHVFAYTIGGDPSPCMMTINVAGFSFNLQKVICLN